MTIVRWTMLWAGFGQKLHTHSGTLGTPEQSFLTLIRAGCVRLADSLRRAGMVHEAVAHWIDGTKNDPVPEVRYARDQAE